MPFYTYAYWRGGQTPSNSYDHRYLLITPNRETADTFYRGIQEAAPMQFHGHTITRVDRLSPQVWTFSGLYGHAIRDLIRYINDGNVLLQGIQYLKDTRGKINSELMAYDEMRGPWPIISDLGLRDHVDKGTCFIRNKYAVDQFWFCEPPKKGENDPVKEQIQLSTTNRSRFSIEFSEKPKQDGLVILSSDKVKLKLLHGGSSVPITIQSGYLFASDTTGSKQSFRFDLFDGGFQIKRVDPKGEKNSFEAPCLTSDEETNTGAGQVWELC